MERDAAERSLRKAAFFGFRPRASPPAVVPPQLVSPAYTHILDAVAAPAAPPASWGPAETQLYGTVRRLLALGSDLHPSEEELHMGFLKWHSDDLLAGQLTLLDSSTSTLSASPNGILTSRGPTGGESFAVVLLECKSDVGAGNPLVQALRHYQIYYGDGTRWAERATYRCDPMPVLVLLLEGPRLSIHAAWTIYQNRVGYAPLTPSYYLANETVSDNSNVWKLMAVLSAYKKAVKALDDSYTLRKQLLGEAAMERAASLRVAAHTAGVATEVHTPAAGGAGGVRPCTLPYGLLDEALGLSAIAFRGPGLMYEALQQVAAGGEERSVLVKFVQARYGTAVHKAWHAAGLAPELYDVRSPAGGGTSGGPAQYLMVVMELLHPADGWMPLQQALVLAAAVDSGSSSSRAAGGGGAALKDAVRQALHRAHAVPVEQSAAAELVLTEAGSGGGSGGGGGSSGSRVGGAPKAVHGDMRPPNIMVRSAMATAGASADVGGVMGSSPASGAGGTASATGTWHVRFIDFDWAGLEGDADARYPVLLSPLIRWPEGVAPGTQMRQQHDTELLELELAAAGS
ncbi:hypothetical protein CHLRE_01g041400v5 [Chlamydomonas reinhardtii]|uniref:Protein kinase domain-containing protein n=1 Tax=Chlamydomonas reinhardtii TaxID=3055 RepID=A0A2K3E7G0_CHLRE|nr:uncharacterized protein CHLRE_01g041400v5 [Chlamydomonas reinhardtii]PNW88714.1 hypothetical protein CHLRE_01g041400v5 [Chlamydomonas reinhardtii]